MGLIEGLGEGTALLFKIVSGPLSDRLRNRKALVLIGYTFGALSKPLFAVAQSASLVMGARFFDRMGKGIRGAPRDALLADIAPASLRGKAFGLRQALDTTGAFIGPLLAMLLMSLLSNDFRTIFWIAVIPGLIAVLLIVFGVREPEHKASAGSGLTFKDLKQFSPAFWLVCACGAVLQLAKFSEAFLILRAKDLGLSFGMVPLVLVAMNIVYSLSAYPAGALSDRIGRRKIVLVGFFILILADLTIAYGAGLVWLFAGIALWGLHLGLTQGVLAALVADTCPAEYRGTAFGIFNLFSAGALIVGSPLAGYLWDHQGAPATFLTGATIAALGLIVLFVAGERR